MIEVTRQSLVRRIPVDGIQHAIQFCLQSPGSDVQAMRGDLALLTAVPQLEAGPEQILRGKRKSFSGTRPGRTGSSG